MNKLKYKFFNNKGGYVHYFHLQNFKCNIMQKLSF